MSETNDTPKKENELIKLITFPLALVIILICKILTFVISSIASVVHQVRRNIRIRVKSRKYLALAKEYKLPMTFEQATRCLSDSDKSEVTKPNSGFLIIALSKMEDWSFLYLIGQCHLHENRFFEAVNCFVKASGPNDSFLQKLVLLEIGAKLLEKYILLSKEAKDSCELEDRLFTAANRLGHTYRRAGIYSIAYDWYMKAKDAIYNSATIEGAERMLQKINENSAQGRKPFIEGDNRFWSYDQITEVLRSDLRYAELLNNIGLCLIAMNSDDEITEAWFEKAIAYIPDGVDYPEPQKHLDEINAKE